MPPTCLENKAKKSKFVETYAKGKSTLHNPIQKNK